MDPNQHPAIQHTTQTQHTHTHKEPHRHTVWESQPTCQREITTNKQSATPGFAGIGPTMSVSVQDVGGQLQANLNSRLVQYVMAAREQLGSQSCWHVASDKAFAVGMHLQNSIIPCPNNRAALCCPQATQMS